MSWHGIDVTGPCSRIVRNSHFSPANGDTVYLFINRVINSLYIAERLRVHGCIVGINDYLSMVENATDAPDDPTTFPTTLSGVGFDGVGVYVDKRVPDGHAVLLTMNGPSAAEDSLVGACFGTCDVPECVVMRVHES